MISLISLIIHNCLLQLFFSSSQAKIKDGTHSFCLLPRKFHYPWKAMWLHRAQCESKEAIHKDKLSVSRKWRCYQTANCSPHFLWIFEWVTKNSSVNSKQLWQLKLLETRSPPGPWWKDCQLPCASSCCGSTEGVVSDLFYSDRSYEKSDLSLHIRKRSSPQISRVILNSFKCNDF